ANGFRRSYRSTLHALKQEFASSREVNLGPLRRCGHASETRARRCSSECPCTSPGALLSAATSLPQGLRVVVEFSLKNRPASSRRLPESTAIEGGGDTVAAASYRALLDFHLRNKRNC